GIEEFVCYAAHHGSNAGRWRWRQAAENVWKGYYLARVVFSGYRDLGRASGWVNCRRTNERYRSAVDGGRREEGKACGQAEALTGFRIFAGVGVFYDWTNEAFCPAAHIE